MKVIETARLILRTWREADAEDYFRINQDPKVTEFLSTTVTLERAKDFIAGANKHFHEHDHAFWAAELKETGELIGFIGLAYIDWRAHFTPAVEIGWRLGSQHWGKGYATEGAKAALDYGFNKCGLKEIVSFTVPANARSIRVMEKIGMKHDVNDNFVHPKVLPDHPLSQHVLYRIKKLQIQ